METKGKEGLSVGLSEGPENNKIHKKSNRLICECDFVHCELLLPNCCCVTKMAPCGLFAHTSHCSLSLSLFLYHSFLLFCSSLSLPLPILSFLPSSANTDNTDNTLPYTPYPLNHPAALQPQQTNSRHQTNMPLTPGSYVFCERRRISDICYEIEGIHIDHEEAVLEGYQIYLVEQWYFTQQLNACNTE